MTTETKVASLSLKGKPVVHCMPHMDTWTAVFIVSCPDTKKAALIDSCADYDISSGVITYKHADTVLDYCKKQGLEIVYTIDTHVHADHLTAMSYIKAKTGCKTVIGSKVAAVQEIFAKKLNISDMKCDGSQFDMLMKDGGSFALGNVEVQAFATPGHTPACMSWLFGDALFTGDTIFLSDVGTARCDFPAGSADDLWNSINKLLTLPDSTRVYIGHDYPDVAQRKDFKWETTIKEERENNKQVKAGTKKEEYLTMRKTRDASLAVPRLLYPSIQWNLRAGHAPTDGFFKTPITVKA